MKGRKPKPNHLHLVDGTARGDRGTNQPDKATGDLLTPPADLSPEERVIWMSTINVVPPGLLRAIDELAFRLLVEHVAVRRRARKQLAEDRPLVVKTKDENLINNPYLGILNRQTAIITKLCAELGLTPTARSRIILGDGEETDPVEERYFR